MTIFAHNHAYWLTNNTYILCTLAYFQVLLCLPMPRLRQSQGAARTSCETNSRNTGLCKGLATDGGPWKATKFPTAQCNHHLNGSGFWFLKASRAPGVDSAAGRPPGRGIWEEAHQVWRSDQRMLAKWLESKMLAKRTCMQGLCSLIPIQSPKLTGHWWRDDAAPRQQREPQGGCGSREESHGGREAHSPSGHELGRLEVGVWCWKAWNTRWFWECQERCVQKYQ